MILSKDDADDGIEGEGGTREQSSALEHGHDLLQDLHCPICLRLLYEPSVLPCGHACCAFCLSEHLRHAGPKRFLEQEQRHAEGRSEGPNHKLACPTCRRGLGDGGWCLKTGDARARETVLTRPAVALAFAKLLERTHPEAYRQRRKEVAIEEAARDEKIRQENWLNTREEAVLDVVVLDPILPGQVLDLTVFEPRYLEIMRRCLAEAPVRTDPSGGDDDGRNSDRGTRRFAMLGSTPRVGNFGTEVEVVAHRKLSLERMIVRVKGRRVFRIEMCRRNDSLNSYKAWVRYVADEEKAERLSSNREAQELAENLEGLVAPWLDTIQRGAWEWQEGQMTFVLNQLGSIPPATAPSRRALWATAIINPLPGLGVAREIRPAVLRATGDASQQLNIVREAMTESEEFLRRRGLTQALARVILFALVAAVVITLSKGLSSVFPIFESFAWWLDESCAVQCILRGGSIIRASSPKANEL